MLLGGKQSREPEIGDPDMAVLHEEIVELAERGERDPL